MLSTLERVLLLKGTNVFAQVAGEELVPLAQGVMKVLADRLEQAHRRQERVDGDDVDGDL